MFGTPVGMVRIWTVGGSGKNLEHVAYGSTKSMVDESKLEMTPALDEGRSCCIVGGEWQNALGQVSE